MDLLVIDRDAVGEVDLIWHFMTARLATSSLSGVLSPLSTGTKPPGSHLRDQGEESNAVRKKPHFDFELLEPRGFVHFATKEGALRVLEESLVLGWWSIVFLSISSFRNRSQGSITYHRRKLDVKVFAPSL